ncbi:MULTISPECIES: hypothetical protein [Rhodomicrobium]|uniref:hypothetical protein n=1 Tax=Rhodomicrobium TaxID=1068 RepID=UPI000B4A7F21|nr:MULTISPECIES: hypothetical protein [Rhodomicrobium]
MAAAISAFLRGAGTGLALLLGFAGAAMAQTGADSLSRADDVVTQADMVDFASGLVGKPVAVARSLPTPEELDQKAKRIAALGSGADRSEVKLGDIRLTLEPPGGHCFLDASQPSDARLESLLHSIFRGELRMLGAFADCAQLKSWRTGQRKTLSDYGQFLVPLDFLDKKLEGAAKPYIETMCKTLRDNGGELIAKSEGDVRQRFEQVLAGAKMNEVRFLGVVGQDDNACYFGLIQNIITEHGDPKTQVDVSAISFISGKMVYINLYAVHQGDETLTELFERQKSNVERNIRVNGG